MRCPKRVKRVISTLRLLLPVFPPIRGQFLSRLACLKRANHGSSQHPPRLGYHGQFRLSSRSGRRFGLQLFQKSQKSLTGFCVQFLGIQRPIMI
jgi:hypothetical protein